MLGKSTIKPPAFIQRLLFWSAELETISFCRDPLSLIMRAPLIILESPNPNQKFFFRGMILTIYHILFRGGLNLTKWKVFF
jgi:hypothetical protein